jgi:hypothetical protein
MLWSALVTAAGLVIALAGVAILFIAAPPVRIEHKWGEPVDEADEKERAELGRIRWLSPGKWLLLAGTFIQLIGTVWLAAILACRR